MSNLQDFYFMKPEDFKRKIKEKYGADGLVIDDCVVIPFYQVMDRLEKLEKIEQIVERFKSQYDHTSNLDLMVEIKEILEQE